jgi:hypothetical protein
MSVAEWFGITSPLSKYYVRKTVVPGPDPNLGLIQPIASGNVTASNVTNGTFTWYQYLILEVLRIIKALN